ncbi:unnamed protein product [Paramecium primaurelia]|uniref:HSF-type DNA-binding domain-containing protein n=1 Tax=Paramecium primaurelia TaxID=5886 RepID=A0A8S1NZR2_PARPR|nr:unnamed protein product [Paramecium primaurelia]
MKNEKMQTFLIKTMIVSSQAKFEQDIEKESLKISKRIRKQGKNCVVIIFQGEEIIININNQSPKIYQLIYISKFLKYSMDQKKSKYTIPSFIIKLHTILEDINNSSIITWAPQGDAFIVLNPELLEQQILPQHFKHNHFTSFLRQLNMYDFQKIRNQNNQQVFWHQNFLKGKEHLLVLLKRSQNKMQQKQRFNHQCYQRFLIDEITSIKQNLKQDEQQFTHIINQHEIILQQHKQIYLDLQQQREQMEIKYEKLNGQVQSIISWYRVDSTSQYLESCSQEEERSECFYSQIL